MAPRVAHALVRLKDEERPSPPGQVVAGGKPGLTPAHDDRLESLGSVRPVHLPLLSRASVL